MWEWTFPYYTTSRLAIASYAHVFRSSSRVPALRRRLRDKPKKRLRWKLGWLQTQQEEPDTIFRYSVGETKGWEPEKKGTKGHGGRERKEWEREVLQGQKAGEIGGKCATIISISQSKKGLMVRNQKNRGAAENARYESTEISKSPYPPAHYSMVTWWQVQWSRPDKKYKTLFPISLRNET